MYRLLIIDDEKDIRDNMKEMFDNLDYCKYRDCMHIKEDNCKIKELVDNNIIDKERYEDYIKFIKEKENEGISFNTK